MPRVTGGLVLLVDANRADGNSAGNNYPALTAIKDLISNTSATMAGFASTPQSGYSGSGIAGNPNGIVLDGADDRFYFPRSGSLKSALDGDSVTIEVWFSYNTAPTGISMLFSDFGWDAAAGRNKGTWVGLDYGSGKNYFNFHVTGPQWGTTWYFPSTIQTNRVYHIVCTYQWSGNSSTMRVYLDGVQIAHQTAVPERKLNSALSNVTFGANNGGGFNSNCKIYLGAVYNKSLSLAEIQQNYNHGYLPEPVVTRVYTVNSEGVFRQGDIRGLKTSEGKLELPLTTFTRASVATAPDGTQVASGVPRYGDGPFVGSKAVFVERGTTNLLTNAGWKDGTLTGYSVDTSAGTVTVENNSTYGKCLRITGSGFRCSCVSTNYAISNTKVTVSVIFKVLAQSSAVLKLTGQAYNASISSNAWFSAVVNLQTMTLNPKDSNTLNQGLKSLGDGWYHLFATCNYDAANIRHQLFLDTGTYDILLANSQAEALPYPTSFISGTRQNENLSIAQGSLNHKEGTIFVWWKPTQPKESMFIADGSPMVISIGQYPSANNIVLWCINAGGASPYLNFRVRSSDGNSWVVSNALLSTGQFATWYDTNKWYRVALRWSNYNTFAVFIDEVKFGEYVSASNLTALGALNLGSNIESPSKANAYFADLTIFNTALSDADIIAKQALTTPVPIDPTVTYKTSFDGTMNRYAMGQRTSLPIDLSEVSTKYRSSKISYSSTAPTGTDVQLQSSIDNGTTWHNVANNAPIPLKQGLYFDGVDDKIEHIAKAAFANAYNFSDNFSIEFDVTYPSTIPVEAGYFFAKWYACFVYVSYGSLGMYLVGPTTSQYISLNTSIAPNERAHIVITFSGGNIKVYKNGVYVRTVTSIVTSLASVFASYYPQYIGSYWNNSKYYAGTYHTYRLYNVVLTDAEVKNNYNGLVKQGNRVWDYRFDEGTGNVIYDHSPCENHLTIPSTFLSPWTPKTNDYTGTSFKLKSIIKQDIYSLETNLSVYNETTWAEWTKATGVTGSATGLKFLSDGTNIKTATLPMSLLPSTKYCLLYEVTENTLATATQFSTGGTNEVITAVSNLPKTIGFQKFLFTTPASIVNNRLYLYTNVGTSGNYITIKNVKIIKASANTEIEFDCNYGTGAYIYNKYFLSTQSNQAITSISSLVNINYTDVGETTEANIDDQADITANEEFGSTNGDMEPLEGSHATKNDFEANINALLEALQYAVNVEQAHDLRNVLNIDDSYSISGIIESISNIQSSLDDIVNIFEGSGVYVKEPTSLDDENMLEYRPKILPKKNKTSIDVPEVQIPQVISDKYNNNYTYEILRVIPKLDNHITVMRQYLDNQLKTYAVPFDYSRLTPSELLILQRYSNGMVDYSNGHISHELYNEIYNDVVLYQIKQAYENYIFGINGQLFAEIDLYLRRIYGIIDSIEKFLFTTVYSEEEILACKTKEDYEKLDKALLIQLTNANKELSNAKRECDYEKIKHLTAQTDSLNAKIIHRHNSKNIIGSTLTKIDIIIDDIKTLMAFQHTGVKEEQAKQKADWLSSIANTTQDLKQLLIFTAFNESNKKIQESRSNSTNNYSGNILDYVTGEAISYSKLYTDHIVSTMSNLTSLDEVDTDVVEMLIDGMESLISQYEKSVLAFKNTIDGESFLIEHDLAELYKKNNIRLLYKKVTEEGNT